MKGGLPLDPLALLRPLFHGIGGLEQSDQVRRGMHLHATLPRPPVGTTPHVIVHTQNKLTLRYYAPPGDAPHATPVVVVPSMINRATICDLEPDRSLVGGLAAQGHHVFLVDWGVPGDEDATISVEDVVLDLLHRAIDRACRHVRAPRAFLLGYCQGGTISTLYAALRPRRVAGLAVFNAPVRFSEGGRFRDFANAEHIDLDALIDPTRLVPVSVMQVAFKFLDPMGNWHKFAALERDSQDPGRLKRSLARERWLEENVPLPGTFALEFIRRTYQEDALLSGTWTIGGERVDLSSITCPVLVNAAKNDFIAPAPSVTPLADAVGSQDVTCEVLETGHIGIVVGSFGPRVFYPYLSRWFTARDAGPRAARSQARSRAQA
jgi:polyhydroxyalkanoate synthase subunit PhaC